MEDAPAALVNCNNGHWTVLYRRPRSHQWVHINSVLGNGVFHGRRESLDPAVMFRVFAGIQEMYGGITLHRVTRCAASEGYHFLAAAGMRAMLPPEVKEVADAAAVGLDAVSSLVQAPPSPATCTELRIVSVNVDGLGDYGMSPVQRMGAILDKVLAVSPDMVLLQEVVAPMYAVVRERCAGWQVHRKHEQLEEYFLVTAVKSAVGANDKCTSFAFPSSRNGRHLLTVRRGCWSVVNVHAESGGHQDERDERAKQISYLSRAHEQDCARNHVLAGDFNLRPGEEHSLHSEDWSDVWLRMSTAVDQVVGDVWTWKAGANAARYDRIYTHAASRDEVHCVECSRIAAVWGSLTDHVALHAVLQRPCY